MNALHKRLARIITKPPFLTEEETAKPSAFERVPDLKSYGYVAGLIISLLITLIALLGIGAIVDKATAAPTSPGLYVNCISINPEWNNLQNYPRRMSDMEAALDATGTVVWTGNHGQQLVKQYRVCGWGQGAMFVQIAYAQNRYGWYMAFDALLFDLRGYPLNHHPLP